MIVEARKLISTSSFNGERQLGKTTRPISETSWSSWLGQIYNYGASVRRARNLPLGTMKAFFEILHARFWSDGTIDMILSATGIDSAVSMSAVERLRVNGISDRYVEEVIAPQITKQLGGQKVSEINDLALSMAMEREDQGELYSGGKILNVLEEMLGRSSATVKLKTRVVELKREEVEKEEEKWVLVSSVGDENDTMEYSVFDRVIVAAPWDITSLIPLEQEGLRSELYIPLYVTFITSFSDLSTRYFGVASGAVPKQMLTVPSPEMGELDAVQEIAYVRNVSRLVDGKPVAERLYRILSSSEISNRTISPFFENGEEAISWIGRSKACSQVFSSFNFFFFGRLFNDEYM